MAESETEFVAIRDSDGASVWRIYIYIYRAAGIGGGLFFCGLNG